MGYGKPRIVPCNSRDRKAGTEPNLPASSSERATDVA